MAFAAAPALAHGEQILIFPASFALLLFLAVVIFLLPWHRWWAKAIAVLVLLGSNLALWFALAGQALRYMERTFVALLIVPIVIAALAIWILSRVGSPATR